MIRNNMNVQASKRVYTRLPVWIVEDHHDVVRHIYRAIGSRHLPMKNIKMVHFDSHPDLLIPVNMPADTVFDKEALLSELSIENWIMPMVYAGHLSHVTWLHPYWAQQIKEGEHSMCVGRDSSTTTIRVTSKDNYFLSDGLYVPQDQLEEPKRLQLSVVQVNPVKPEGVKGEPTGECHAKRPKTAAIVAQKTDHADQLSSSACGGSSSAGQDRVEPPGGSRTSDCACSSNSSSTRVEKSEISGPSCSNSQTGSPTRALSSLLAVIEQKDAYILDIDLDFFSCTNPFKEMYTQEEYAILKELYSFQKPREDPDEDELADCIEGRVRQLEDLEAAFADLIDDDGEETLSRWAANPRMGSIVRLVHSLQNRMESPDYEMVHQAGLTCDHSELPHHVSDEEEIEGLLQAVSLILQELPRPTLVTMSRSSLDEYCPAKQVNSIQNRALRVLEHLYGSLDIHPEYAQASS